MTTNPLQSVIERACTDAPYRARLLASPAAVLAEAGIEVPADVEIRVHENTEQRLYVILPARGESGLGGAKAALPIGPVADVPAGMTLEWQQSLNLPKRTLVVRGRIDETTAPALRREIDRAFTDVDLDLSGVSHMTSAGIGALVSAQQGLRSRDCTVSLRLVPEKIRNLLELSGLLGLFTVQDVQEYREFFPKGAGFLFGGVAPTRPITDD